MGERDPGDGVRELRDRGRAAYRRRAWIEAFTALAAADEGEPLPLDDLDLLATSAYLTGKEADGDELAARAYREWLDRDAPDQAARRAIWLALLLLLRGEAAASNGWRSRAKRLIDDGDLQCSATGYLHMLTAMDLLEAGDAAGSLASARAMTAVAERFSDPDLMAFGQLCTAEALVPQGEIATAKCCLDDAMVAVTAGEVSPLATGVMYCAVIIACQSIFDLHRAQEWTMALSRWCDEQPDLVPYRGNCQIHRAEIMRMRGAWSDAYDEIRAACERLAGHPVSGAAHYELAELHRLRGQVTQAERAYREACRWIPDPQPGLALLRLRQGRFEDAAAAIRRSLDEATGDLARSRLLGAAVEILIGAEDVAAAREGADELRNIAERVDEPWLIAMSRTAEGATLLAEGDGRAALPVLRRAWSAWQGLEAPYEAARVRVLMARACQQGDDPASAEMELDAAIWVFEQLGAAPDIAEARVLSVAGAPESALTPRELEVLQLVAAGLSNRAIAAELILSDKTVARHLSNIFAKLDLSSRAAAIAYAYEHDLV
ncbi:MAG TPA: LuxR C-terminal-related transcriptional regulator [Nocardioidaceae bacterium]|nr:LuxR C-terminal-related transcriptional regulator [Nocardioidaceae bacterium]